MNPKARRLLLILASVVTLLGVASAWAATNTPAKPGFGMRLDSSTSSVTAGQSTSYRVVITRDSGFTAGVTVTTGGLPSGTTATIAPNPVASTATGFVLTVVTETSTKPGTYTLAITGTSGSVAHAITASLSVAAPVTSTFSLSIPDDNQNVPQGNGATYTVAITRTNFPGAVALTVSGLPSATTATFSPSITTGSSTSLVVQTSSGTPQGSYPISVKGVAGAVSVTVTAHLTVSAPKSGKAFTVSGNVTQSLAPGVKAPIDVTIVNPNNNTLAVTSLSVAIVSTSKPACDLTNFSVTQYAGSYPLTVPANSSRSLSQMGVTVALRPAITFLDLPRNQDVCKLTTLNLTYSGTGQGTS